MVNYDHFAYYSTSNTNTAPFIHSDFDNSNASSNHIANVNSNYSGRSNNILGNLSLKLSNHNSNAAFGRRFDNNGNSNGILSEITNKYRRNSNLKKNSGAIKQIQEVVIPAAPAAQKVSSAVEYHTLSPGSLAPSSSTSSSSSSTQKPLLDTSTNYFVVLPLKATIFAKPTYTNRQSIIYQTSNANFWKPDQHTGKYFANNLNMVEEFIAVNGQDSKVEILPNDNTNAGYQCVSISSASLESLYKTKFDLLAHTDNYAIKKISLTQSFVHDYLMDVATSKVNTSFLNELNSISKFFNVEIFFDTNLNTFNKKNSNKGNNTSGYFLQILGSEAAVSGAELRCKLLIDDFKNLFVDSISVDLSMINLIGGINLDNFKNIIKQTGIFIYIPGLLNASNSKFAKHDNNNRIFLAGAQSQVLHAKFMLKKLKDRAASTVFFKDIRISKTKLNHMLANMKNSINEIMYNNGSFVQFPDAFSDSDTVRVQAMNETFVEKTLKQLMELQSEIYELEISIVSNNDNNDDGDVVDKEKVFEALAQISNATNTLILLENQKLNYKIIGKTSNVKDALQMFKAQTDSFISQNNNDDDDENGSQTFGEELDFNNRLSSLTNEVISIANSCAFQYRFNIELLNAEKEFICGKKNGKLIKIMNQTSTLITFKSVNEYNFLIQISSDSTKNLEIGLRLLELEFPSELSFYIPEIYHRQIIGIGGNLIQSIMRKYNVFIKFSNTFELKQDLISFKRFDNVLVKCPKKNATNIPRVKQELEMLVKNCQELNFINFRISENQYKLFLNNFHGSAINEIEKKTNSFINFPIEFLKIASSGIIPSQSVAAAASGAINITPSCNNNTTAAFASSSHFYDIIDVKGIDTKSSIEAFKLLAKNIAREIKLTISSPVSNSFKANKIISHSNEEFLNKIVVPFNIFLNTEIKVLNDSEIVLTCNDMKDSQAAIEALEKFLKDYDFKVIDKETIDLTYNLIDLKRNSPSLGGGSGGSNNNNNNNNKHHHHHHHNNNNANALNIAMNGNSSSNSSSSNNNNSNINKRHFHSQSLNISYNNGSPMYKQNMMRSPPTYHPHSNGAGSNMQFSPIDSEFNHNFSFAQQQQQQQQQQMMPPPPQAHTPVRLSTINQNREMFTVPNMKLQYNGPGMGDAKMNGASGLASPISPVEMQFHSAFPIVELSEQLQHSGHGHKGGRNVGGNVQLLPAYDMGSSSSSRDV